MAGREDTRLVAARAANRLWLGELMRHFGNAGTLARRVHFDAQRLAESAGGNPKELAQLKTNTVSGWVTRGSGVRSDLHRLALPCLSALGETPR